MVVVSTNLFLFLLMLSRFSLAVAIGLIQAICQVCIYECWIPLVFSTYEPNRCPANKEF